MKIRSDHADFDLRKEFEISVLARSADFIELYNENE